MAKPVKSSSPKDKKVVSNGASLTPVRAKEIMDVISKEIVKSIDSRDYRKSLEERYKEVGTYAAVKAAAFAAEKLDENTRKTLALINKRFEETDAALNELRKGVSTNHQYIKNTYTNTDSIMKGISNSANLIKKLHEEMTDNKKKTLTMIEAVRNEVINLQNENAKATKGFRDDVKANFEAHLNSLNALGQSNAKIMEELKKNTLDNKKNLQEAIADMKATTEQQMGEIKGDMKALLDGIKGDINTSIESFDTKVNESLDRMNSTVEEFKTEMASVKTELKEVVDSGNEETQKQLKAIGGGLAKQNEVGFNELKTSMNEMIEKMNESLDRQQKMFEEAIEKMRTDVVEANAKELSEMKKEIADLTEQNKEILDAFRQEMEKYLKKEIADLRDTLSSIRADMEMEKHLLTSIADRIKR